MQVDEGGEERGEGGSEALYKLVPLKAEGGKVRGSTECARFNAGELVVAEVELLQPSQVQPSRQGGQLVALQSRLDY